MENRDINDRIRASAGTFIAECDHDYRQQLHDAAGMSVSADVQGDSESDGYADVAEVEQIEEVALRQPEHHSDRLERCEEDDGPDVFPHAVFPPPNRWILIRDAHP